MTKAKGNLRWDTLVAEAAIPDLELDVSDTETLHFKAPTGEDLILMSRAGDDPEALLSILCGDAYDRVRELIKVSPAGAMNALVTKITKHFGVQGEAPASPR